MSPQAELTVRQAYSDLRYIRALLEEAGTFTAVPGAGLVAMGVIGLAAAQLDLWTGATAAIGSGRPLAAWIWGAAFVAATGAGFWTMARKAKRLGLPLRRGPFIKVARGLLPPIAVGGVLTAAAAKAGAFGLIPGLWLAMYGTAVLAGGQFSVRPVRAMGLTFVALGSAALLAPETPAPVWLGLGFGLAHMVFGAWIAVRHDG